MKKMIKRTGIIMALLMAIAVAGSAQVIVTVRPAPPVVVRPASPSPTHVWIDGEWVIRGGHYEYAPGYWVAPRHGFHWVPGHWAERRGGWVWIPGHWVRHRW